jgi:tRNA pseudouridine38-40 synthase
MKKFMSGCRKMQILIHRYFIHLSYRGTNYHGWQIQPNAISVQEVLAKTLSTILGEKTEVTGAGRTDTGVHTSCFYAHFDTKQNLSSGRNRFVYQCNGLLPEDIAVQELIPVKADVHARFHAISRTYEYHIIRKKDPFLTDLAYFYHGKLSLPLMQEAARYLIREADFTSFSRLHSPTKTNICKIMEAGWKEENDKLIFMVKADRFLRNMVRAIVGTLLQVGTEKIKPAEIENILIKKDRSAAGPSAPAQGLFLTDISYPEDLFL